MLYPVVEDNQACFASELIVRLRLKGLLFSSNFAKDDVGKNGQHFIEALADFAVKHIETFAVLYVSLDESAEKMEVRTVSCNA